MHTGKLQLRNGLHGIRTEHQAGMFGEEQDIRIYSSSRTTNPIPRRIPYGPGEPQTNPANFATAAARYTGPDGSNSQFGRIWWSKL